MIAATELPGAAGGLAACAALGAVLAESGGGVVLIEAGAPRSRKPTVLASAAARQLEAVLAAADFAAAARGRLCWVALEAGEDLAAAAERVVEVAGGAEVLVHAPPDAWRQLVETAAPRAALVRAELPRQRSLAALVSAELRELGIAVRIAKAAPGAVGSRRALAGLEPGGEASRRAVRLARGLAPRPGLAPVALPALHAVGDEDAGTGLGRALRGEAGQALPLALGATLAVVVCALALALLGGAVAGKARAQRAADLAALSAARSMRDDFPRLFVPARRPDGSLDARHLERAEYLDRAREAAAEAIERNGGDPRLLSVGFPGAGSFAPLRVTAELRARLDAGGDPGPLAEPLRATAEAVPPGTSSATDGSGETAGGGDYAGPLAERQGERMRPDVAAAFDGLAAAAARDGVALVINSGYRSDAEQAALFAQNPDPRMVAPPGQSLHRCGTELDLGPPAAYGWLAANAPRFGFVQRYSWEPWHWGFDRDPAPCSAAASGAPGGSAEPRDGGGDGEAASTALPAFVPARYREAISRAATRWNVSAALLAAQLMAESNFNPFAVSPAGARGIAQFMPATAAAYGLDDPFDAEAAIDAQAHLMSDLLRQFGSPELALAAYNAGPAPVAACDCVPDFPETQAYVARIIGLLGGAGAIAAPPALEVRLVG